MRIFAARIMLQLPKATNIKYRAHITHWNLHFKAQKLFKLYSSHFGQVFEGTCNLSYLLLHIRLFWQLKHTKYKYQRAWLIFCSKNNLSRYQIHTQIYRIGFNVLKVNILIVHIYLYKCNKLLSSYATSTNSISE